MIRSAFSAIPSATENQWHVGGVACEGGAVVGPDAGLDRGGHPHRMKARAPNHESYSVFVSLLVDGPCRHVPVALNRDPWHGQSHVVSPGFHRTMHPMCGHTADNVVTVP